MVEYSLTKKYIDTYASFTCHHVHMSSPCGTTRQHPILKELVAHLNYVINNFNTALQSFTIDGINHNYLEKPYIL